MNMEMLKNIIGVVENAIETLNNVTVGMLRTEIGNIFRIYLIMSLTGSIAALLLFLLKPIIRNRLPKSVQYYSWIIVLVAYLVPFSLFISFPSSKGITPIISDIVNENVITGDEYQDREVMRETGYSAFLPIEEWRQLSENEQDKIFDVQSGTESERFWLNLFMRCFATFGVQFILIGVIIDNGTFVRKLKKRNCPPAEKERLILEKLCINNRLPKIFRNPLAETPMLIGLFRPMIILPDCEYTDVQLRIILQHEVTHLQRKDIIVKWLSILAWAMHFLNPIIWLVRREIDRACELSCDEAVIRNLDEDGKQNYGETLIYVAADVKKPRTVFSTTMCEEKKTLKKRLGAIMKSKKYPRMAIVLSVLLILTVCSTVIILGAGRTNAQLIKEKGLYLFENDIQIYADDDASTEFNINNIADEDTIINFNINAIVVGDDIVEIMKSGNIICYLGNGENTVEAKISVLNINKANGYYDVVFVIACNLPEGHYLFDDLIISDSKGENRWSASGDIEIIIEPKGSKTKIENSLTTFRNDEICEFVYTILNPTNDDIIISVINGNIQNSNLLLINDVNMDNDIIDYTSFKKFSFPVTLSANKEAYFYYSIPINEQLSNTYLYLSPSVDYKVLGSDEINKLYFGLNSDPPIIQKKADDILKYINEKRLAG